MPFRRGFGLDRQRGGYDPSAPYILYLPFSAVTPVYRSGATRTSTLALLPGFSYARSGASKLESKFLGFGDELVANGGFNDASVWALQPGWTITGGVATSDGTQAYTNISQNAAMVAGKTYRVSFSITAYTSGAAYAYVGGTGLANFYSAVGSYSENVVAGSSGTFYFRGNKNSAPAGTFNGSIDNVSVKEVFTQTSTTNFGPELVTNGTFDTDTAGWARGYGDPAATFVANAARGRMTVVSAAQLGARFTQPTTIKAGRRFRIVIDVVAFNLAGGTSFDVIVGLTPGSDGTGGTTVLQFSAGVTTGRSIDLTSTLDSPYLYIGIYAGGGVPIGAYMDFDNISVKEIISPDLTYLGPENLSSTVISGAGWQTLYGGVKSGSFNTFGSQYSLVDNPTVIIAGRTYKFDITVRNVSGNTALHLFHEGSTSTVGVVDFTPITITGAFVTYSVTVVANIANVNFGLQDRNTAGFGQIEVQSATVKEVIPYALNTFATNVPGIVPKVGYYSRAAVTNNITWSQDFSNAAWAKSDVTIVANAAVAPDGTTTMSKIVEGAAVVRASTYQGSPAIPTGLFTMSVFAKNNGRRYFYIRAYNSTNNWGVLVFDLQTGTITSTQTLGSGITGLAGTIVSVGNGIYRCTATGANSVTVFPIVVNLSNVAVPTLDNNGDTSYQGDGVSGIYVWQAQGMSGAFPDGGPIIPTTTAAVTVGTDTMAVGLATGNYNLVYTLGDGSVVTVPTVIPAGSFTLPVFPGGIANSVIRSLTAKATVLTLFDSAGSILTDSAGVTLTTRY